MRTLIAIAIILLITACSRTFEKDELIGIYVRNVWRHDTIRINEDGTYNYTAIWNKVLVNYSGTWELNPIGNEIAFKNLNFMANKPTKGKWISRIRTREEKPALIYASDSNIFFGKLTNKKDE